MTVYSTLVLSVRAYGHIKMNKPIKIFGLANLLFIFAIGAANGFPNKEALKHLMVEQPQCFADDPALVVQIIGRAKNGDTKSQYCLAERYYYGHGVELDHLKAIELYEIAGRAGYAAAMSSVCELNLYGVGVTPNYKKAIAWCKVAANRGYLHAQTLLADIYLSGHGVEADYAESLKWALLAAEKGQPVAQFIVGLIYYEGLAGKVEKDLGKEWLTRSAANGSNEAEKYLENNIQ